MKNVFFATDRAHSLIIFVENQYDLYDNMFCPIETELMVSWRMCLETTDEFGGETTLCDGINMSLLKFLQKSGPAYHGQSQDR